MLVKCPSCATTYRVSNELLTDATPAFRCSRCKHTFELEHEGLIRTANVTSVTEPAPAVESVRGEDELSLSFPSKDQEAHSLEHEHSESTESAFGASQRSNGTKETDEEWSLNDSAAKDQRPFSFEGTRDSEKYNEFLKAGSSVSEEKSLDGIPAHFENSGNILALDPYRDQQASTIPYLSLFVLLTLSFTLFTAFHYAYPETMDGWIRKIPLLGSAVVRNAHLKNGVALQAVRGSYQTIQGNREVFLVTGTAMNQNAVVIREVRVGGDTFADGKVLEQQTMWIGNAISPKIIRGMTAQDVADLQRLKPLKSFDIPPGDSVPFTMIFLKSTKAIKEFTCQVVAAEEEF